MTAGVVEGAERRMGAWYSSRSAGKRVEWAGCWLEAAEGRFGGHVVSEGVYHFEVLV